MGWCFKFGLVFAILFALHFAHRPISSETQPVYDVNEFFWVHTKGANLSTARIIAFGERHGVGLYHKLQMLWILSHGKRNDIVWLASIRLPNDNRKRNRSDKRDVTIMKRVRACCADETWTFTFSESVENQACMKGRVVNKVARHNLCYADTEQLADYENKKGTIINFNTVPLLKHMRVAIRQLLSESTVADCGQLFAELNHYYDVQKCGIGWHGDGERRIVIGVRVGASMKLVFHWFHRHEPVGGLAEVVLNDSDLYLMSEKAVGNDWKRSIVPTLRHAAGGDKYTKLPNAKAV